MPSMWTGPSVSSRTRLAIRNASTTPWQYPRGVILTTSTAGSSLPAHPDLTSPPGASRRPPPGVGRPLRADLPPGWGGALDPGEQVVLWERHAWLAAG